MIIVRTLAQLESELVPLRAGHSKVGLVPTMGALHQGHVSLVDRARQESDYVVVSIFVNPTQFNNPVDLATYPRSQEQDIEMLEVNGCDLLFMPTAGVVYPEPDSRVFDFTPLDKVMEGAFRPGHFNGVAQVVSRLFDMIKPDIAFFGEKDFQQLAIIMRMTREMGYPIQIVACPTVREPDGLAMSSRNRRLSSQQRQSAAKISEILFKSCTFVAQKRVDALKIDVIAQINQVQELEVEYFEIVDATTLQPISNWEDAVKVAGCIAVFCGEVRLIDHIDYK